MPWLSKTVGVLWSCRNLGVRLYGHMTNLCSEMHFDLGLRYVNTKIEENWFIITTILTWIWTDMLRDRSGND
jgi:hypothetical protein